VDTGVPVAFSSAGSLDPDGGALRYHWDFGDGASSDQAEPTHTYVSSGRAPTVTNRTITLTVTDDAGNVSATETQVLAIRDVGAVQQLVLTPEADTYVNLTTALLTTNYGTRPNLNIGNRYLHSNLPDGPTKGYLRFNLGNIDPTRIVSATLRLYSPPGASGFYGDLAIHLLARETSDAWTETTLTGANAPLPGAIVGGQWTAPKTLSPFSFWLEVPLTDSVRQTGADGQVSYALELTGRSYFLSFYTKQLLASINSSM
jgi:hypothetical protein